MNRYEWNESASEKSAEIPQEAGPKENNIKINGLQQVVELLRHADPAFRESLLRRLTQRDPKLAQNLKRFIR